MSHNAALTEYRTLGWIFCKSYVLGFSRETELTGGVCKIRNSLCGYGGWEVPQLAVCKLYTQESWWYYSAWVQRPGNQRSLWCFFQSDMGGLRTRLGYGWRVVDLRPRVQRPRTQEPWSSRSGEDGHPSSRSESKDSSFFHLFGGFCWSRQRIGWCPFKRVREHYLVYHSSANIFLKNAS